MPTDLKPMNTVIQHRPRRGQAGFTLIELMVVVLIIGILLAIAIPTFLGARTRSQDAVAKSGLRTALTAANVIFTDSQTYENAGPDGLAAAEGSLKFIKESSEDPKTVSVYADADTWAGASRSESGTCFYIRTDSTGAVTYGSGEDCTGTNAHQSGTNGKW